MMGNGGNGLRGTSVSMTGNLMDIILFCCSMPGQIATKLLLALLTQMNRRFVIVIVYCPASDPRALFTKFSP